MLAAARRQTQFTAAIKNTWKVVQSWTRNDVTCGRIFCLVTSVFRPSMYALGLVFGGHTAILCPTVDMGCQESSIEISDPADGSTKQLQTCVPAELYVRMRSSERGAESRMIRERSISWRVGPQPSHEGS